MTLLTVFLTQDCLKIGHANSGTKRDDDAELRNLNSYYNYYTSRVILVLLDHDEKRAKMYVCCIVAGNSSWYGMPNFRDGNPRFIPAKRRSKAVGIWCIITVQWVRLFCLCEF